MKLDLSLQVVKDFNQDSYSFDLKTYALLKYKTKQRYKTKLEPVAYKIFNQVE